jgi:hypothetical protein
MNSAGLWRTLRVVVVVVWVASLPVFAWAAAGGFAADTASPRQAAVARARQVYAATSGATRPAPVQLATILAQPAGPTIGVSVQQFKVGFDKELVDPTPAELASHNFHLGGYGILPTRASTGPLVDGDGAVENIYVRAMAISNNFGQTLLLAALENQGSFAAYKEGPYGIYDMRQQVHKERGVPVDMIVVNTDHSHAGPDLIGLWGGVPVSYMKYVKQQVVLALERAYDARVPADLRVGSNIPVMPDAATGGYVPGSGTPGEFLDHSQFDKDNGGSLPNGTPVPGGGTGYRDDLVDTQLRVLQAYDAGGKPLGTLINYAAHATVMDGGNVRYSADWPGRVARATETALGEPVAVTMVADVGRTQPPRPNSDKFCDTAGHISCNVDKLDTWTRLFSPWVVNAVNSAVPVEGNAITGKEVFTQEVATNAALLGVSYSGEAPVRGYGAYRSSTPPWISGDVVGTFASAHRIGNVLLTANPGEAYPDIRFAVQKELGGIQSFFTFGLANDQLGYLIAPASEYGWIAYSKLGNDNAFFNVSAQYGDHLYCTLRKAGNKIGFALTNAPKPYGPNAVQPVCPVASATDVAPMGPAPQQPWPFGDGQALPPPFPQ